MKEEEVVRLKQILNNKEDIIRKVSIAYEQSKNSLEEYQDQIEYYKHQIEEYEKLDQNNLLVENQNLKMQNRQLMVTLMNHLTKANSRKGSKKKKRSRFGGTLMGGYDSRKSGLLDSSMRKKHYK